jgi:alpha,alpha-trehalase
MNPPETHDWKLIYRQWDPQQEPLREALCTLGNGYFATRGAAEETQADGVHYPGTYVGGGYNRLQTEIAGRVIENEDLVNFPNWLCLNFRPEGGEWFDVDAVELLDFHQELDLKIGLLERRLRFRDAAQRETTLVSRRIVSMAQPHLAALEWTLTPENWSGRVEVRSALDGTVINSGVARYRELSSRHLEVLDLGPVDEEGIYLSVQTNQSHIRMAQAARLQVCIDGKSVPVAREIHSEPGRISQSVLLDCQERQPLKLEKVVAIYSSRDHAISEPGLEARNAVRRTGCFADLLRPHAIAWAHLWRRCDIGLTGSHYAEFILRLHIFHLLQTASKNTVDRDVGVPARGLHGEAYRGHVFWDEIFIFPFLNFRIPELTRELLLYRYRRLPEARRAAQEQGFRGAMFPWQSGSNGREETQHLHLNPRSGRWLPDNTHRQRHVNAAIAYNVWQYYEATGDMEFLSAYGAELIVEIARFWASVVVWNPQRERYEIHGIVGPDEFHTKYPDSDDLGLNNNAYTNVMASWVLNCALRALSWVGPDWRNDLIAELGIDDWELKSWEDISRRMFVPFHDDGIISQFEGYERLEEFDWDKYREKYGDIQRLDRILEAEGDSTNRYQAGKQADVLMLFYLFSFKELSQTFQRLGYPFERDTIPRNISYYMKRTSHGSTLSRVVHSWVLARSDRRRSWELFQHALESDVSDIQGGTTSEGIHLGAMAGTVDLVQRGFTGLEIRDEVLWLDPTLPDELPHIHLDIYYREHWLSLDVNHETLTVRCERGWSRPATVGFRDEVHTIDQGQQKIFPLKTL